MKQFNKTAPAAERIPSFSLTNSLGQIKHTRQRIEEVKATRAVEPFTHNVGRFKFWLDVASDRLVIEGSTRDDARELRRLGYLWSRKGQRWQRKTTPRALREKQEVIDKLQELNAPR